jgi:YidC/Oxa1 family membrane protein insertase
MEVKRTILALAISFAILVGWNAIFPPAEPTPVAEQAATAQTGAATAGAQTPAAAGAVQVPGVVAGVAQPATIAVPEQRSVLANDRVKVALTNWGGRITSVTLNDYNDVAGPDGVPLVLLPDALDVVGSTTFEGSGLNQLTPFAVVSSDASTVTYSWTSPTGLTIEKSYTLEPGRYDVAVAVKVVNATAGPLQGRLALSMSKVFDTSGGQQYIFVGPSYYKEGTLEEVDLDDAIEKGASAAGGVSWAGAVEKYFMTAILPENIADSEVRITADAARKDAVTVSLLSPVMNLAPGAAGSYSARIFNGPKQKAVVEAVGNDLSMAIDFGWFSAIARPMVLALDFLYGIIGNYGIAIIILTTLIKLLFWPLSAKSYKSMARMKELQPKIAKLKEKFGDDKEKLNQETMQLWKTHKVNPMGGCLPIFLQIPVFIALYRALMSSIELRHAPFAFWLVDLSEKDPYYVTPILMGASMFVQQQLTPASGASEGQMKFMMYGMPLVFTWMFLDFPSGLVIYWLWNNLLSIGQQASMMRGKKKAA